MPELLPGAITISRVSYGGDQPIRITVEDERSRMQAIEVRMTLDAFAKALTGLSYVACAFTPASPLVGKWRQHKTALVRVPQMDPTDAQITVALVPFEVDGWQAYRNDLRNWHQHSRDDAGEEHYQVSFERWVDTPPSPPEPE